MNFFTKIWNALIVWSETLQAYRQQQKHSLDY